MNKYDRDRHILRREEVSSMQKGNTLIIAVVIVALLLVGGGVAYFMTQSQQSQVANNAMDSMAKPTDAMMEKTDSATDQASMESEDMVTIDLSAENYAYSQEEITVKKGDTIKIVLNVTAGMHDFVVDEFDVRTEIVSTGESTEITFVADESGEFEYYCSVGNHRQLGMVGTLVVEE